MNVNTEDTPIDRYAYVMDHITREVVNSLSPVGHEFGEGLYRVPVQIKNEQHTVYVGDNHKRMFDADTLPDFMKHRLAMITVSDKSELLNDEVLSHLHLFATKRGNFECIGWRVTHTFYIVIMTGDELKSLKGTK